MKNILMVALIMVAGITVSFLIMSGLLWIILWAFGIEFTWKICIGVYVLIYALNLTFKK